MKKHGVAEFGQACVTTRHVPQNTCCRHKGLHDYKRVSSRPAYTAEHKSTWNYFFFSRLNKFDEYNVSSQATAWVKK